MDRIEPLPNDPETTESGAHAASRSYLAARLSAVRRLSTSWPRRRRIRALQELLLDANDLLLHCVDELEAVRSGARFLEKRPDFAGAGAQGEKGIHDDLL